MLRAKLCMATDAQNAVVDSWMNSVSFPNKVVYSPEALQYMINLLEIITCLNTKFASHILFLTTCFLINKIKCTSISRRELRPTWCCQLLKIELARGKLEFVTFRLNRHGIYWLFNSFCIGLSLLIRSRY